MAIRTESSCRKPPPRLFVAESAAAAAERHAERLRVEVRNHSHRSRKLLLRVRAIARQTVRDSADLAEFSTVFDGRIAALGRVHDELARNDWRSADLRKLLEGTLEGVLLDSRYHVSLQGPEVRLGPDAALALALPLHELASQAMRRGALSDPAGSVAVEWREKNGYLTLSWIESGADSDGAEEQDRFGTMLLTQGLEYELDAEVHLDHASDGLQFFMRVPLPA